MTATDYNGWAEVFAVLGAGGLIVWTVESCKRHYRALTGGWKDGDCARCPECGRRERLVAGWLDDEYASPGLWTERCGCVVAVEREGKVLYPYGIRLWTAAKERETR